METKNVIKALGIVGLAAGVMLAAGDAGAQDFDTNADNLMGLVLSFYDTGLGKLVIVAGSIIAIVSYIFTQKVWTLVIAACIVASPALMGGIKNLVEGASSAATSYEATVDISGAGAAKSSD